jgi:rhodanese-related sulfurtransferase
MIPSMSIPARHLRLVGLIATVSLMSLNACSRHHMPEKSMVNNPDFDQKLQEILRFSVPVMSVHALRSANDEIIVLDTRALAEYDVSHIPGARFVGYESFDPHALRDIPFDAQIVVYCSVGYRSEKIGERLRALGYRDVHNLYGSIFEWVNRGYAVVDSQGNLVQAVHTYNQEWSKWVTSKTIAKTW